jgi:hypothetical protein
MGVSSSAIIASSAANSSERLEHTRHHVSIAHDGLVFLACLDDARLDRPFEGEQAPARLAAHSQRAAAATEQLVPGVEHRVFLEPAASERRRARSQDGRTCF